MTTNPEHINQLAAIIREVDGLRMIASAAERAEAMLSHPGWPWQPPAALAQPEVGEVGEQEIEAFIHQWWEDFGRGYLPNSSDKALVAAALTRWGRPPASSSLPANYIDPEHQGGDLKLLQTFYQACHAEGGTADEIHLRGLRAVLAARPAAPSAPEPVPDKPAESLAARQLLEKLARLDDLVGITVAEVRQLADQAAAWLRANPPGQPVAIEPRGCPLPGACSCVVPGARPAPEVGEVGDLIRCLQIRAVSLGAEGANLSQRGDAYYFDRAATLLSQLSAPAPAVVPVAKSERLPDSRPESEGGDCDAEGRCWVFMPRRATPFPHWTLLWIGHMQPEHSHWRPASAIPLPQAGEVEA